MLGAGTGKVGGLDGGTYPRQPVPLSTRRRLIPQGGTNPATHLMNQKEPVCAGNMVNHYRNVNTESLCTAAGNS
jgi:hypothetical protein